MFETSMYKPNTHLLDLNNCFILFIETTNSHEFFININT